MSSARKSRKSEDVSKYWPGSKTKNGNLVFQTGTIIALLLMSSVIVCALLFLDFNEINRYGFYITLFSKLNIRQEGHRILEVLSISLDSYSNIILTYNTMLTAIVIFLYTILDNKHMGMPIRRLITYAYGRLTVPIVFEYILILTPIVITLYHNQWRASAFVGMCALFFMQIWLTTITVRATSMEFCIRVVQGIEQKRYKKITSDRQSYLQPAQVYFLNHMDMAFESSELLDDKVQFLRAILEVPFLPRKRTIWRLFDREMELDEIESHEIPLVYHYYYNNIYAVCQSLNRLEGIALDPVHQVLCVFLNRLTKLYSNADCKRKSGLSQIYHAVFSAIMAAVTFSGIKNAESRCYYFLDTCMDRGGEQQLQLKLYLSYCYFLSGMEKQEMELQHLEKLKCLTDWTDLDDKEAAEISVYWNIWSEAYPMTTFYQYELYNKAIRTLMGIDVGAELLCKVRWKIEQRKKGQTKHEGTNDTITKQLLS